MRLALIGFTSRGCALVKRIMEELPGGDDAGSREAITDGFICRGWGSRPYGEAFGLEPIDNGVKEWTEERFRDCDGLVFVGAAGIAVRMIAPYIRSKTTDPAVLVIDERGQFVISLLSGHIGGANRLTARLAGLLGAIPVITTATDVNGLFAVDEFAARQNLWIGSMKLAKTCAARLLAGEPVGFSSDFAVEGRLPRGLTPEHGPGGPAAENKLPEEQLTEGNGDFTAGSRPPEEPPAEKTGSFSAEDKLPERTQAENTGNSFGIRISLAETGGPWTETLYLVPRIVTLGLGCRRGKSREEIEAVVREVLESHGISRHSLACAASADRKADEQGILELCAAWNIPFLTYNKEELLAVPGSFSSSEFVESVLGVDNVCERSAIKASGGRLLVKKQARDGVTVALAISEWRVCFE